MITRQIARPCPGAGRHRGGLQGLLSAGDGQQNARAAVDRREGGASQFHAQSRQEETSRKRRMRANKRVTPESHASMWRYHQRYSAGAQWRRQDNARLCTEPRGRGDPLAVRRLQDLGPRRRLPGREAKESSKLLLTDLSQLQPPQDLQPMQARTDGGGIHCGCVEAKEC